VVKRYEWLDIVRGFLALLIIAVHATWFNGWNQWELGQWTVNCFIILSGFVITMLLEQKQEPYGVFLLRRAMRLFPVYLVCLIFALAIRPWLTGTNIGDIPRENAENAHFWPLLISHLTMLHGAMSEKYLPESSTAFLPPAWSISLEMQLYLVAPLLVLLFRRKRGLVLCGLLMSLSFVPKLQITNIGAFLPQKMYLFIIGGLLYTYADWIGSGKVPQGLRPGLWLGAISYPVYLSHWPLMMAVNALLPRWGNIYIRAGIEFLIAVPIILGVSQLLHRYVEKPGMRLGKRWANALLRVPDKEHKKRPEEYPEYCN
jgi:peptidoglycan/LPS O-acetylase OafA/YrhL